MESFVSPYERQQQENSTQLANLLASLQLQQGQQGQAAQGGAYNILSQIANGQGGGGGGGGGGALPPAPIAQPGNPPPNLTPAPVTPVQSQSLPNVPMPGASPMGGGAPPPQIPPVQASQLQPPQQGAAPQQPPGPVPPPPSPMQMDNAQPPAQAGAQGGQPDTSFVTPADHQFFQQQIQGPNGPDVMQLIKTAKTAMPDASPQERMAAVKEALSTVNSQTSQYLKQMQQMLAMTRLQTAQGAIATPEEIKFLAEQYNSGNQAALTRQSPATRLKVAQYLADQGVTGTDAANNAVEYHGRNSEASAAGRRTGNIDVAVSGAQQIAPMALQASAQVPRSSWLMAAKMGNWVREQTNDPALAKFQVFNLGLSREYAQAFGGTVAAQNHAQDVLGAAKDQNAYKAAVEALQQEMAGAQKGGRNALKSAAGGINIDAPAPPMTMGDQAPAGSDNDPLGLR